MKEELNIWTKNYIDVNSLVTEKFMIQKALDKAKTDFESLTKKYQDLEMRHRKIMNEYNVTKAKCDSFQEYGEGRWVEGANSEHSDQDSGKHSDTSLVNSSEECWAEIDKINKSYNKRQNKNNDANNNNDHRVSAADTKIRTKSSDGNRSKYLTGASAVGHVSGQTKETNNLRNVTKNTEQRPAEAAGPSLTPTSNAAPGDCDSDKSSYSEKQEKEELGETGVAKMGVNVVTVKTESDSSALFKDEFDNDTYVERDALQEETVMVETQTIKINQNDTPATPNLVNSKANKIKRHTSNVKQSESGPCHSVTRVSHVSGDYNSSSYDDVPLPPSPRPVSKYRNRDKSSRKDPVDVTGVAQLTDDDTPTEMIKRQPRPPIRRRPRSKMIAERPKSAPPEKYDSHMFNNEKTRSTHFSQSRGDLSDEEFNSSETYLSRRCLETGESNQGTLETVSAKSFGFIRPSQRLLEREHNKRLKRHKSFFNTDSLFGKKNSLIRRAESFHHGSGSRTAASQSDYCLMNGKYYSKDAKNRAKSVDRLLSAGDETCEDLDRPLIKSKSMEFLKSKILRKPSKLQKKSVQHESFTTFQSMFELHKTPHYSPGSAHTHTAGPGSHGSRSRSHSRLYPDWTLANSSLLPSSEFSKQDVRHSQSSSKLCETTQKYLLPPTSYNGRHVGSQNYDWRQDTPFWNYSRQKRKENVINWGLVDPPPTWVPPPPQSHVHQHHTTQNYSKLPGRKSRESLSPVPHQIGLSSNKIYPSSSSSSGLVLNQAVNHMYLPSVSPVSPHYHGTRSPNTSMASSSMLEITELEDEPLVTRTRSDNIIEHQHPTTTARILEMPSGLY